MKAAAILFCGEGTATERGVGRQATGFSFERTSCQQRAKTSGGMRILHAPISGNCPALDRVHVVEQRARLEWAPFVNELLVCRLSIASFVGGATLNDCGRAIPDPREAKARLTDRQHRVLQCCQAPALAAIGRDLDP